MKVNYFGYCLRNSNTEQKVLFDIRRFLKAYCRFDNIEFKNRFRHTDEHVYLLHHVDDVFMFIITRSNEIVRKINTNDLSIGEIHSLLEQDEQLGFASYVIVKDNSFGFGSTMLAPKFDVFCSYVNNILEALGIVDWVFNPEALLYRATKAEALQMSFIGKTTIELSKENSFVQDMLATISADTQSTIDLEGIEITIKPKPRKNIKDTVEKFLDNIPDAGVYKMIMKAKDDAASCMTDLYLVGNGAISDSVDKSREARVAAIMDNKMRDNQFLSQKINEYTSNEDFEENPISVVVRYHDDIAWSDFISNLQQDSTVG